jgi:hypothetical protein
VASPLVDDATPPGQGWRAARMFNSLRHWFSTLMRQSNENLPCYKV